MKKVGRNGFPEVIFNGDSSVEKQSDFDSNSTLTPIQSEAKNAKKDSDHPDISLTSEQFGKRKDRVGNAFSRL